jgi:hypothetical protein
VDTEEMNEIIPIKRDSAPLSSKPMKRVKQERKTHMKKDGSKTVTFSNNKAENIFDITKVIPALTKDEFPFFDVTGMKPSKVKVEREKSPAAKNNLDKLKKLVTKCLTKVQ